MKWMIHWKTIRKQSLSAHWQERASLQNNGSNNQYYLKEITKEYAKSREDIQYKDSMVYIVEKEETEPARILTTIFKDDEDRYYELTVSTPSIEKMI